MDTAVYTPAKGPFFVIALMMFFLTLAALASIGFVPSYIDGKSAATEARFPQIPPTPPDAARAVAPPVRAVGEPFLLPVVKEDPPANPERIIISAINLDLPVNNPEQTSVAALDHSLLSGTVRYPLSAKLNEAGNVFIFGHSSSLPVVKNQMFKAFNGLSELSEGDTIELQGSGQTHVYRVKTVRRTDVSEALVDLSPTGNRRLTLSTCDSFGGKTSRFVVEAEFFGSYKTNAQETQD